MDTRRDDMKLWIVVYRFNPLANWKQFADSCFDDRDLAHKYVDVKRYNDPGIMLAILECTAIDMEETMSEVAKSLFLLDMKETPNG